MIDISTRTLRAMLALDDLRNFSLAAERCHVTQSALSQMVRKLEDDVGLQLVDRDRRRVEFTPEGRRFLATAQRVMHELDEIDIDLKDHASAKRGRIQITALPSLAAHWLPSVVARYKSVFPGVELGLFDATPLRSLELVRLRQADFAITADGPGRPGLEARLLLREPFVLVCHRTHALAKRRRVKLQDLQGQAYIRLIRNGSIAQHLESALRELDLVETGLEVEQVATVAGLVAANLGISVVPALTVPYFDAREVAVIELDAAQLHRPVYLVSVAGRPLSKAAQEFIKLLDESVLPLQAEPHVPASLPTGPMARKRRAEAS
ncbi:MAG: LysR substrate-binding domain-containing protein [Pseudomonadota bacterium]